MASPSRSQRPDGRSAILSDPREIAKVLDDCVDNALSALIVSHDTPGVARATFQQVTRDSILFTVAREPAIELRVGAMCSVSFHEGQRARVFLGRVRSFHSNRAVIWRPTQIVEEDARLAFRLDLFEGHDLMTKLTTHDWKTFDVRPIDIGAAGMLVEFAELPPSDETPLEVDEKVVMTLEHRGIEFKINGVIRRRADRQVAVYFPQVVQGALVDPPTELREIMSALQREWLQARRR